jgi:hypothetical protein
MSVDQRLREELATLGRELPPAELEAAYLTVTRRGSQARRVRATVAGLAAAAVLVVGVGVVNQNTTSPQLPDPSGPSVPEEGTRTGLEGTYQTKRLSFADLARTLRNAGLEEQVAPMRRDLGDFKNARLRLRVADGMTWLRIPAIDFVRWEWVFVEDGTVRLVSSLQDRWDTRFALTAEPDRSSPQTIRLDFQSTSIDFPSPAAGEAWERALYTTAPFHRASDVRKSA